MVIHDVNSPGLIIYLQEPGTILKLEPIIQRRRDNRLISFLQNQQAERPISNKTEIDSPLFACICQCYFDYSRHVDLFGDTVPASRCYFVVLTMTYLKKTCKNSPIQDE